LESKELYVEFGSRWSGGNAVPFTRWTKAWVVVALCSVLVYVLYWLYGAFVNPYFLSYGNLPENFPPLSVFVATDYVLPVTGNTFRFIGVALGLLSAYLVWGPKPNPFASVKKKIAVALLFEGVYFLSLLPLNILLAVYLRPLPLFIAFILQALLVSPLLIALSIKIWRYQETDQSSVLKWVSAASIGYLTGVWVNNVFRWLSMTELSGISFLLTGITSLGFLNSIITLSLSLVLAVAGFYTLAKENRRLSTRLFALALIMLGLHFVLFTLYTAIADAWKWLPLIEIWPISLLGLGLSMLREKILHA
jgi:hypothetical protein